jgi:hypothetical protein
MNTELISLAGQLAQAHTPEQVFGELTGGGEEQLANLKRIYRRLAKIAHPDIYQSGEDRAMAQRAFNALANWFAQAAKKIKAQQYGQRPTIVLRTKKRSYRVSSNPIASEIYNLYSCTFDDRGQATAATLRVVRDPHANDLALNESKILRALSNGQEAGKFSAYIPRLIDAFTYQENGVTVQANIIDKTHGWYSLEDVRRVYPPGLDPKDMAWMWRRLLVALGFAHINGIICAAVLPKNIWILPHDHGLRLENWLYAVQDPTQPGKRMEAIDPKYRAWYPPEVLNKDTPVFGTDIAMSAKCMVYVLGGDPIDHQLPSTIPAPIQSFLAGCLLPDKRARHQDAWGLKEEFDWVIEKLWGTRTFHPFHL